MRISDWSSDVCSSDLLQEIRSSTCVCQDLTTLRQHRFHVSRLKRFDPEMTDDPAALAAADREEFVVEDIIDHRGGRRRRADMQFKAIGRASCRERVCQYV